MITRLDPDTGKIRDLIVDGTPAAVQVDSHHLYWIDLDTHQILRTPLWSFDTVGLAGANG